MDTERTFVALRTPEGEKPYPGVSRVSVALEVARQADNLRVGRPIHPFSYFPGAGKGAHYSYRRFASWAARCRTDLREPSGNRCQDCNRNPRILSAAA